MPVPTWINNLRKCPPERFVLLGLLLLAGALWWLAIARLPRPLEVVTIAVGHGDAFLIKSPTGKTVLIDGGSRNIPEVGERVLVPSLLVLGVRRLDAIIITHPDSDHVNGLAAVLDTFPVGMILDPDLPCETPTYQHILDVAARKGVPRHRLRIGDRLALGRNARLTMLAPAVPLLRGTTADDNNNSAVCLLEYGAARMLFTGDLAAEGERALLARTRLPRVDILKIAHHGSPNGTSDDLLNAVRPQYALISCQGGRLPAEQPNVALLAALRARGIRTLRTDLQGQIRLATDGNGWRIRAYKEAGPQ